MYSNLLYVSIRSPKCTDKEIKRILEESERNNPEKEITGVLLYTSNRFVQFLEGTYDSIKKLYDKIRQDDRHRNVMLISLKKNASDERVFPGWAMGGKAVDDQKVSFESQLTEGQTKAFESILNGKEKDHRLMVKTIEKIFN